MDLVKPGKMLSFLETFNRSHSSEFLGTGALTPARVALPLLPKGKALAFDWSFCEPVMISKAFLSQW